MSQQSCRSIYKNYRAKTAARSIILSITTCLAGLLTWSSSDRIWAASKIGVSGSVPAWHSNVTERHWTWERGSKRRHETVPSRRSLRHAQGRDFVANRQAKPQAEGKTARIQSIPSSTALYTHRNLWPSSDLGLTRDWVCHGLPIRARKVHGRMKSESSAKHMHHAASTGKGHLSPMSRSFHVVERNLMQSSCPDTFCTFLFLRTTHKFSELCTGQAS